MSYTLQEIIQETVGAAVKQAVQKAKLDLYPVGKTWLTFGDENPADIVGGGRHITICHHSSRFMPGRG